MKFAPVDDRVKDGVTAGADMVKDQAEADSDASFAERAALAASKCPTSKFSYIGPGFLDASNIITFHAMGLSIDYVTKIGNNFHIQGLQFSVRNLTKVAFLCKQVAPTPLSLIQWQDLECQTGAKIATMYCGQ